MTSAVTPVLMAKFYLELVGSLAEVIFHPAGRTSLGIVTGALAVNPTEVAANFKITSTMAHVGRVWMKETRGGLKSQEDEEGGQMVRGGP